MAKKTNSQKLLVLVAVIGILLLASLAGNVVLLGMLLSAKNGEAAAIDLQAETAAQLQAAETERDGLLVSLAETEEKLALIESEPAPVEEPAEPDSLFAEPSAEPEKEPEKMPAPTEEPKKLEYEPTGNEKFVEAKKAFAVSSIDLKVRSGPGTNYAQLGTVSSMDELSVTAGAYDWFFVEYAKGKYGWVSGSYLFGDWMFNSGLNNNLNNVTKPEKFLDEPERLTTTSDNNNVRSGPATANELVSALAKDREFIKLGTNKAGDWYFGNFAGSFGWCHKNNFK